MSDFADGTLIPEGRELEQREGRTEGVLVSGLTWADVEKLSLFEGEDYSLGQVAVEHRGEDQDGEQRPAQVTAQTYIWKASTHVLEPELWRYVLLTSALPSPACESLTHCAHLSFEAFANDKIKISKWSATVSFPSGADGQTHPPPLTFGHAMLAHFCFAPGYINLCAPSMSRSSPFCSSLTPVTLAGTTGRTDPARARSWPTHGRSRTRARLARIGSFVGLTSRF